VSPRDALPAETILFDGHILTQDGRCPRASALFVRGERIVAVGGEREMLSRAGPHPERLGLEGRTVLPGLVDAHLHLDWYARSLSGVAAETATRAECLARVRARARVTPPGEWIVGSGWNHNAWGGVYGTRAELDEAAPQHAVGLTAKSGHAAWVNTRALAAAGITADTPDPPGGRMNLPLPRPELYDLESDPEESSDVAEDNPEIVAQIRARMEEMLLTFPENVIAAWRDTMRTPVEATESGALPVRKI